MLVVNGMIPFHKLHVPLAQCINVAVEYSITTDIPVVLSNKLDCISCDLCMISLFDFSASGGELHHHVISEDFLPETDTKRIMRQILSGIQFLHDNDIVHLDIKVTIILSLFGFDVVSMYFIFSSSLASMSLYGQYQETKSDVKPQ